MSIKKLFAPVDMTQGNPIKQIILFAIPMIIGNFAQQLYNTVDSIIVGHYVGDNALAAVGSAGPILNLMLVLFIGVAMGASIMVSQYFGARKKDELSRAIGSCITLTAFAAIIIMVFGTLLARPLLNLLGTPQSIIDWCHSYLIILFIGFAGGGYYNILGGILRGLGDSMSALLYLIIATILNIVLDLVFVAYFNMGVAGVALATVMAQFVSAILTLRKLLSMKDVFELKVEYLKPEKDYSFRLIKLGLPSGVTQAIFSLSLIVVQSLTNTFGEQCIAANVITMRVDGFVVLPAISFSTAMTTYSGQNIGAGRMDRVIKGARQGTIFAMAVSAVLSAIIVLFGRYLMGIFTETEELIEMSYQIMLILAVGYIIIEITQCLGGVMRGAGDTVTPMWISIISSVLFRVPAAYIMVELSKTSELPQGDFFMMSRSMLLTWIFGATLTFIAYKRGKWKNKAIVGGLHMNEANLEESRIEGSGIDESRIEGLGIDESRIEESRIEGSGIDESRIEGLAIDESPIEESTIEESL